MSTHHWWTGDDGYPEEITDRIDIYAWELRENAEEGSSAMSTITVDDPDMIHDYLGHRAYWVTEDLSDEVIFYGFIADQTISHGDYAIGRQWRLSVADINSILFKRVMTGVNSNRPAETDVERLQWLITTHEGHAFDNTAAYISTASPVNMDANDYRGRMASEIINDCAQQSGKNWYAKWFDGTGIDLVYHASTTTAYPSTLALSNDPADLDFAAMEAGTATTWPISDDTTLARDPSRDFSGVYEPYDGGAVYRQKLATATLFTWYRDCIQPAQDVHTYATAVARVMRYLNTLGDQDLRITTSVILPASLVNEIRPGMSLYFRATHLPGVEFSTRCYVLSRSVKTWAIDKYMLTLELSPLATLSCSTALSAGVVASLSDQSYTAPGVVTVPITPTADASLVFCVAHVDNNNTPGSTAMAGTGAYTTLHTGNAPAGHNTWATFYAANVAAGATSATGGYTPGYSPTNPAWGAVVAAIATTATTPVQSKDLTSGDGAPAFVTLDSTPTPGNILVMGLADRGDHAPPSLLPVGFWSAPVGTARGGQVDVDASGKDGTWLYMHCVEAGDTTGPYGFQAGGQQFCSVSEWEIL